MKLTARQQKRMKRVAALSGISVDAWLRGVIDSALSNDEGHFREMADREAVEKQVDRAQFARLSTHLRNLPTSTTDELVRVVASARMQGRRDMRRPSRLQ